MADPSQTIILAGSGRSGTTWLGNIIAANPNMRIYFEPFDYRRVPEAAAANLPMFAYARPGEDYPEWKSFIQKALSGKISNEWINRQGKSWWTWKRLIKAIRANLMLGWIDTTFHPKIVFTVRHPCAVVLSRVKLEWEAHLDVFLAQPQLVGDYLEPFVDAIKQAKTPIQQHAVAWCVENFIPLQQLPKHKWILCTYEQLYRQPEQEAERVLAGLKIRKTWFTQRSIKKVSMVTRHDSPVFSKKNPLLAWKDQLSTQEIDDILGTLDAFGIGLYSDQAMPHVDTPLLTKALRGLDAG